MILKNFGAGINKEIGNDEKNMLFCVLHHSIYQCKAIIIEKNLPLPPMSYCFPILDQGESPNMYCEVKAVCKINNENNLVCELSFGILKINNKSPIDIELDTSAVPTKMDSKDLSNFFKDYITIRRIPLYRGVYSFNELPLIIHSFLLPSLKATVSKGEQGQKKVVVEREADFGLLHEDTVIISSALSIKARYDKMTRLMHNYSFTFRVSCSLITSEILDKTTEEEYFYLSMREEVFDNYFTFSRRIVEEKDADCFDYQDVYESFYQKKVHFVTSYEKTKFAEVFKKSVTQYYYAILNRVEESTVTCPVVRINTSLNSQMSISVWLFYEFPSEKQVGSLE